ncbi:hypothetical protein TcWFU_002788 [Taenia crassiceps]|uniref:non-specific protein-tyrosine kinase n=1 Tax=Taenia crassiceps TaxID=6207 RepID=A0ABR4Q681_9CEST
MGVAFALNAPFALQGKMIQSALPDEMLIKFLKFIQLEECLDLLINELEVKSFKDLRNVTEESLRQILRGPATKRLLEKYRSFKNKPQDPKPSHLRPLSEFLAELKLKSFEDDLRMKFYITRVEHLKFATSDDLEGIMDKESTRKLLKAYSKEKKRKTTEKFISLTQNIFKPITECVKNSMQQVLAVRVDANSETKVEATMEKSEFLETKPIPPPAKPEVLDDKTFQPENELVNQCDHPPLPLPEKESMIPKGPPDNYKHDSNAPTEPPWGPQQGSNILLKPAEKVENDSNTFEQPPNSQTVSLTNPSAPPESLANGSVPQSPQLSLFSKQPKPTEVPVDWVLLRGDDFDKDFANVDGELECESEQVPDFFQGVRSKVAWETFSPLIITEANIAAVRQALGLLESPDADLRDALHFVRSKQSHSPFYFQRPPPEVASDIPTEWHHKTAAQMVRLRHFYGLAVSYNLRQCFEALVEVDWDMEEALNLLSWL